MVNVIFFENKTINAVTKLMYWSRGQTEIYGLSCEFVAPPGRITWLPFSERDMSLGLRNPCFAKFSVVIFL